MNRLWPQEETRLLPYHRTEKNAFNLPGDPCERFLVLHIYIYEYNFIYLFLAVLGLRGCAGFSLMAVSKATVVAVCGLLIAMASFVAEHKLQGL